MRTVWSIGGGGLGAGGVVVVGGGITAARGQNACGASLSLQEVHASEGRVTVNDPLGQGAQVLDNAVVFHGHMLHEAAAAVDIIPGGQVRHACRSRYDDK